jgi:hypothetical protein
MSSGNNAGFLDTGIHKVASFASNEYNKIGDDCKSYGRKAQAIALIGTIVAVALLVLGIVAAVTSGPVGIALGAAAIFISLPLFYAAYNGYHIGKNLENTVSTNVMKYIALDLSLKEDELAADLKPGTIAAGFMVNWGVSVGLKSLTRKNTPTANRSDSRREIVRDPIAEAQAQADKEARQARAGAIAVKWGIDRNK